MRRLTVAAIASFVALAAFCPLPAFAEGPNAILAPAGYDAMKIPRGDDTSNLIVNLPFSMNWNGSTYNQIYINMNGNCSFGSSYTGYNPSTPLASTGANIMAPLWCDVDTRNTSTGQVTYSTTAAGSVPQVNGHNAFFVNWIDVASYNSQSSPLNSFQLVIVDRSDTGAGNFDFMFNYDKVAWDIATSASSYRARAGWGRSGSGYELAGSGVTQYTASTLLDSSPSATSLIQNSMNSGGQLGRYVWQVRSGAAPNMPPSLTAADRTLEGNAPGGYAGYDGVGDIVAADEDGAIASLTSDLPALLPLGTSQIHWTATDNGGFVATATQSVEVLDTTAPTNPAVSSPSYAPGSWSSVSTVTVDSAGATDTCSGVDGFSYGWFSGVPGTPDTVRDPYDMTPFSTTVTTTVDSQSFPEAAWPSGWTRSNTTYVRVTAASGRTHGTYAVEAWASNRVRRNVNFYRDYDLSGFSSATIRFWDNVSALAGSSDYARVEYSTDGGSTYTELQNHTEESPWAERSFGLPTGGMVRVRFSASVNATSEYADWDDIEVSGFTTTSGTAPTTHGVTSLADGTWYFGLRTVDASGNWSAPVALGPFLIDTEAPFTTDNAPSGWYNRPVSVKLTASDAGVVSSTHYRLGAGAWSDYSSAIPFLTDGTTSLEYYSIDAAGHVEETRATTIRIDQVAPSVPASLTATIESTSSATLSWAPSTDALSGVDHYEVVRDGVTIDTTFDGLYEDVDLTPGADYRYAVIAVDRAGNRSAACPEVSVAVPVNELRLTLDADVVTFPAIDPGTRETRPAAVRASVSGVGEVAYELLCSADDFVQEESSATALPAEALYFSTGGEVTRPLQQFTNASRSIDLNVGDPSTWTRTYLFGFALDVPWDLDPGTYTTKVTYTLVMR